MDSLQAAGFPFANTDMAKAWSIFKFPSLNFDALLEGHRKNAAALTKASQVVFEGLQTLAQRERDLFKSMVDDYSKATSDVLAGASIEEKTTKQADAARHMYDASVARCRELSDIAVKTSIIAVDILNARVSEVFDEFRAALVAPTTATGLGPTSVITEAVAVVEEVAPVGNAVAPVEPTATAAPKTAARGAKPASKTAAARAAKAAPKTAARAAKAVRRPASRS
jgi:phasin family protein